MLLMICFIFFQNLNKFVTSQHIKGPNVNFLTINATSIEYNTIQLNLKIYRNL